MADQIAPGYKYCPKVDRLVSTSLTEGECRDLNRCGDVLCPLEAELGKNDFDQMIRMIRLLASPLNFAALNPDKRR